MWEVRKLRVATIVVAVVETATYPTACPAPTRIRLAISVDVSDERPDLGSLMSTHLCQTPATSYPKRMCQLMAGELAQRFRSEDRFGRRSTSAFCSRDAGSAHRLFDRRCYTQPAPVSIDSSEVEFTTLIEVPLRSPSSRSSESPHDFSTTDDEDTPPTDEQQPLERTPSLKSVASCVGAEYEGEEVRPPQMETQTLAEVTELTASFTTVSDDTSVDDVTVICRPTPVIDLTVDDNDDQVIGLTVDDDDDARSGVSEGGKSMGSCSISSMDDEENQLSDSNTYSCLDCLDDVAVAEAIPAAPEELSTSFIDKDPKLKMELSVIYEEAGNEFAESADGANTPFDEKPRVDAIISAGLSPTAADEAKIPVADVAVKHEPALEFANLSAENVTATSVSSWPSTDASPSTFTQSLETVYEAVAGDDDRFSLTDNCSVDESVTDSALGATDLTFVAEPAFTEGYSVSFAVKKFVLFFAHVLNLVSAVENRYPPVDTSPNDDSKPVSANSNTDPSTDTHSSAALVQHNSNSEGYTISDTSLISCIADSEEATAAKSAPALEECLELYHHNSKIPVEDIETNSGCSEIEEENGEDDDGDFHGWPAEPQFTDFHEEIFIELPADVSEHSWSKEEEGLLSGLLPADTANLCASAEDDELSEESLSSSVYNEKLECCADADKLASYYTICPKVVDCGQDDQLGEEEVFGHSTLASNAAHRESNDFQLDALNVGTFLPSHNEDSSVIVEEKFTDLSNHPHDSSTDSNLSNIEEPDYSFPSHHSSCGETDAAADSSDYFDTVEDANSFHFATGNISEQVAEQLTRESSDCVGAVDESVSPAADAKNENSDHRSMPSDSEIASTEIDDIDEDHLPHESEDCFDTVGETVSSISASKLDVKTVVSSTSGSSNLDHLCVERSMESDQRALESTNIIAQRLQVNADAVCLSFQNFNVTDIFNTKCSLVEPTTEENEMVDGEAGCAKSLQTFGQESAFEDDFSDQDGGGSGSDALQQSSLPIDAAAEEEYTANMSLKFHSDADSSDRSAEDAPMDGVVADRIAILADCADWLFAIDEGTAQNMEGVEYDDDHELGGSQLESDIIDASENALDEEAQEQYCELPSTSDVQCVPDKVAAPEVNVIEERLPELYEVIGRVLCDAANCSFTSSDGKIEYDVNSNQITTDGSPYVTAPQQQTSATCGADTKAPIGGESKQHRRSSSSSSSPDTIHIEGHRSRQGGGHNAASWCQSGDSMGELSLKLRLKVEWDSRPNAKHSSSSSSGDGGAKRSFDDDSLNSSESAGANDGAKEAPNGRSTHAKLLVEFKHNYPKFIQYSYFSPKVRPRRSPKRAPQTAPVTRVRKFGGADAAPGGSPQKNARHSADAAAIASDCATLQSADSARIRAPVRPQESPSGQYLRFDDVTPGSWPSFAPTEAASKSSLLLEPRIEALSFKTSTPKGQQADDLAGSRCAQPPAMDSSLTEFEMWESLLEGDQEGVTC